MRLIEIIVITAEIALITGLTPSLIIPHIRRGNVFFAPIMKKVTTNSSKDRAKAIIMEPINEDFIKGRVTFIKTWNGFAPKSIAASSIVKSNFSNLEFMISSTNVVQKTIWPIDTVINESLNLRNVKKVNKDIPNINPGKVIGTI